MNEPLLLLERCSPLGVRLALLQGGRLVEYYEDEASRSSLVGAVLLGTVERVLPDMKAAFVRLPLIQNGFLPMKEQDSFHRTAAAAPLMTGKDVIVQVKKDAKGDKGVFLTRDVALPGQYVLFMPNNRFIGVSKRISGEDERERARKLGARIAGERFGLIVRHGALFATEDDVAREAEAMNARWEAMAEKARYLKAPAVLERPSPIAETVLRDYAARYDCQLLTDGEPPVDAPENVAVARISPMEAEARWNGLAVERQLQEALSRKAPLPGGGDLVIDEREALQTIDVNSGSNVEKGEEQSLALAQNLAAVPEIARQLRLRNLSGVILVDFIDMDSGVQRQKLLSAMEEAVKDDRVKTVVHDLTELGLMEITRRRTRDSLRDALTEPCQRCRETGRIPRA